jgi:hypothetical protein
VCVVGCACHRAREFSVGFVGYFGSNPR